MTDVPPSFNLLRPPPQEPPRESPYPELWTIQLHWWWRHTPVGLRHETCRLCHLVWPCPSWLHWDDLLRRNTGHGPDCECDSPATTDHKGR